jgi:excisionase family DNA binding protein
MDELEQAIERIVERVVRRILAERDAKPASEYLCVREAASQARVSPYTIRRWVKHGELTKYEAGTRLLVRRDEFERLLRGPSSPPKLSPEERARQHSADTQGRKRK